MRVASRVARLKREFARSAEPLVATVAVDFLNGGAPSFARAFDRKGALLRTLPRGLGEPWEAFRIAGVRYLQLGDVVIHHPLVIHGAGGNYSENDRLGWTVLSLSRSRCEVVAAQ